MKIWLDDIRPPPDDSWRWVKTWTNVCHAFEESKDQNDPIELMSFDHDLGLDFEDGYWIIKAISTNMPEQYPKKVEVHSMNPIGRQNICHWDEWFRRVVLNDIQNH